MFNESEADETEYQYWYEIISDDIKNKIINQLGKDNTQYVTLGQVFDVLQSS
jgi:hypothetical protein